MLKAANKTNWISLLFINQVEKVF
jgi:hypothetical protein